MRSSSSPIAVESPTQSRARRRRPRASATAPASATSPIHGSQFAAVLSQRTTCCALSTPWSWAISIVAPTVGMFCAIPRPAATSRALTCSMIGPRLSTTAPLLDTVTAVPWFSPVRRLTSAAWPARLAAVHSWTKASLVTALWTAVPMSPETPLSIGALSRAAWGGSAWSAWST